MFFVQKNYTGYRDGFKKLCEKWQRVLQKSAMANKRGGKGRKGVIRNPRHPDSKLEGRVFISRLSFFGCYSQGRAGGNKLLFSPQSTGVCFRAFSGPSFEGVVEGALFRKSEQEGHITHCPARSGKVIKSYLPGKALTCSTAICRACGYGQVRLPQLCFARHLSYGQYICQGG